MNEAVRGFTALHAAVHDGNSEIVRLLRARPGINANPEMEDGSTPLYFAAHFGKADQVQLLLEFLGIDVDHACLNGILCGFCSRARTSTSTAPP